VTAVYIAAIWAGALALACRIWFVGKKRDRDQAQLARRR
jgi:hypothetical protein